MSVGIIPWEIVEGNFFDNKIEWTFCSNGLQVNSIDDLQNIWVPDEHDLAVQINLFFDQDNEKIKNVFLPHREAKWQLSWKSDGTKLCGSSSLLPATDGCVFLECVILKGSCKQNLILEPVAIITKGEEGEFGIYEIPPGAILTDIAPLKCDLQENQLFPIYERSGNGESLLNWTLPNSLEEHLEFNILEVLAVEIDINHSLIKSNTSKNNFSEKQKYSLLYMAIISDYIRICLANSDLLEKIDNNRNYPEGSLGHSIIWILGEVSDYLGLNSFVELNEFFNERPYDIVTITDRIFSKFLIEI